VKKIKSLLKVSVLKTFLSDLFNLSISVDKKKVFYRIYVQITAIEASIFKTIYFCFSFE
jgi:hypothetical protein